MITPIFNTQIFNINYKQNFTPSFSSRLPKDTFEQIKDIPHLRCASCDEIMLTTDEVDALKKSFMIPAKQLFECGRLDRFKDNECYEIAHSIAKRYPKELFHEIVEKPEIIQELSKYSKETRWGIGGIKYASEHTFLTAKKFMEKLEKYEDSYKDEHKELYDLMKFYSLKHPNWSFYQIFNQDKVAKYHKTAATTKKQNIEFLTQNVFDKINKYAEKLNDNDYETLNTIFSKCEEDFGTHPHTPKIKKLYYIDAFTTKMHLISDKKIAQKILKELNKLPEFSEFADFFIGKIPKDIDIVNEMLTPLRITFEHIHAKSKNGSDAQGNGIYMCQCCNHKRGTLPYPFLFRINPKMPEFIQKQIRRISSFIKGGKLQNYDTYPIEVKNSLYEETDKNFVLDISNYLKYKNELSKKELNEAQAVFDEDLKFLEESQEKYDVTLANYLKFKNMLKKAQKRLEKATNNKKESEKALSKKTKAKEKIDKIIENDIPAKKKN